MRDGRPLAHDLTSHETMTFLSASFRCEIGPDRISRQMRLQRQYASEHGERGRCRRRGGQNGRVMTKAALFLFWRYSVVDQLWFCSHCFLFSCGICLWASFRCVNPRITSLPYYFEGLHPLESPNDGIQPKYLIIDRSISVELLEECRIRQISWQSNYWGSCQYA